MLRLARNQTIFLFVWLRVTPASFWYRLGGTANSSAVTPNRRGHGWRLLMLVVAAAQVTYHIRIVIIISLSLLYVFNNV